MAEHISTKRLLEIAAAAGEPCMDRRVIEYLCRQGVLLHARRVGGVSGGWTYSPLAPFQLERYLELRKRMPLNMARFMLWIEGYEVAPDWARRSMIDYLAKAASAWRQALDTDGSPEQTAREIAETLAAARGRSALPRLVAMTKAERQLAHLWLADLVVGTDTSGADGALAFERAIGRRNSGGDLYPEFADDSVFTTGLDGPFDPCSLLTATEEASPAELELARRVVHLQLVYGPFLIQTLAWETKSAAPFFQVAGMIPIEDPRFAIGLVSAALARLARRRSEENYEADLKTHIEALEPGLLGVQLLRGFPEQAKALVEALPRLDRLRVARELRRQQDDIARAGTPRPPLSAPTVGRRRTS